MTIKPFEMNYTYLEFGRNASQPDLTKKVLLKIPLVQFMNFEKIFNEFIEELQEDDEASGDADSFLQAENYPRFQQVLQGKRGSVVTYIINNYLFVEFFSMILNKSGNHLVTRVDSAVFNEGDVSLEVRVISR